jgi:hypothetical protein
MKAIRFFAVALVVVMAMTLAVSAITEVPSKEASGPVVQSVVVYDADGNATTGSTVLCKAAFAGRDAIDFAEVDGFEDKWAEEAGNDVSNAVVLEQFTLDYPIPTGGAVAIALNLDSFNLTADDALVILQKTAGKWSVADYAIDGDKVVITDAALGTFAAVVDFGGKSFDLEVKTVVIVYNDGKQVVGSVNLVKAGYLENEDIDLEALGIDGELFCIVDLGFKVPEGAIAKIAITLESLGLSADDAVSVLHKVGGDWHITDSYIENDCLVFVSESFSPFAVVLAAEEEPATEEPATEEPATEEPATEEPATEKPGKDSPKTGINVTAAIVCVALCSAVAAVAVVKTKKD